MEMDVKAIVTLEIRLNADRPFHGAEKIPQNFLLAFAVVRVGTIVFPAKAVRLALTEAVSALTGLSAERISIVQWKS